MKVEIDSAALLELHAATGFYTQQSGTALGRALADEFKRVVGLLAENPQLGAKWVLGTRRLVMRRFPFQVVYRLYPDHILIVALAHQRRRPGYWGK